MSDPLYPPTPGLLDGVEPAEVFNADAFVKDAQAAAPELYDQPAVDDDEEEGHPAQPPPPPPGPEPAPPPAAPGRRQQASAEFIMLGTDVSQAAVFNWLADGEDMAPFRIPKADRQEMAALLAEALPEGTSIPWWIPFSQLMGAHVARNVKVLKHMKAERAAEKNREAREDALDAAEHEARLHELRARSREANGVASARRAEEPRPAAGWKEGNRPTEASAPERTPAPVIASEAKRSSGIPDATIICPECGTNPVPEGKTYCGASCRGRANGRKSRAKKA